MNKKTFRRARVAAKMADRYWGTLDRRGHRSTPQTAAWIALYRSGVSRPTVPAMMTVWSLGYSIDGTWLPPHQPRTLPQ